MARKGRKLSEVTRGKLSAISTRTHGLAVLVSNTKTGYLGLLLKII